MENYLGENYYALTGIIQALDWTTTKTCWHFGLPRLLLVSSPVLLCCPLLPLPTLPSSACYFLSSCPLPVSDLLKHAGQNQQQRQSHWVNGNLGNAVPCFRKNLVVILTVCKYFSFKEMVMLLVNKVCKTCNIFDFTESASSNGSCCYFGDSWKYTG